MKEIIINLIGDVHFTPNIPSSRKDNYPESIKNKYRSVFDLYPCNYSILLGDVFHRPTLPLKYINEMANVEVETRQKDNHKTLVIYGNHDLQFSDFSYASRSALGNWVETQLVTLLERKEIKIGDFTVDILGWTFNKPLPKKREGIYSILIGHAFYENSVVKEKDLVISADEIREEGYDMVVLGHDHAKYEPYLIPGTNCSLYRPGGLSRGTGHSYNVWKEVAILRVILSVVDGKLNVDAKYVIVPSIPPEEAFLEESRTKRRSELKKDIHDFVLLIKKTSVQSEELYDVFDSIEMEKSMKVYIENILTSYGIMRKE